MTELAHTPGPWERRKSLLPSAAIRLCGGRNEQVVCDVYSEADARLIAAALDFLKAAQMQEAAEAFHLSCEVCEGNEIPELCEACFPHYDDARVARRAAVAKAVSTPAAVMTQDERNADR